MALTPATHPQERRGGFTLIEVAVALAIFVIGALAIVRIFPGALSVVQNSGDRLAAVNLNRALLASYNNNPAWVPDGIYDPAPGTWAAPWNTGSTVGSMNRNNALPRTGAQGDFDRSSLAHFKRIQAEKSQLGLVVNDIKTRFPFDGDVEIYAENTVDGVRTDDDGVLDFSQATWVVNGQRQAFPTDAGAPTVADVGFRYSVSGGTVTDTTFYVTYRYVKNSKIWGISDEPARQNGTTPIQLQQGGLTAGSVVPGTVKVRMRRLVAVHNATPEDEAAGYVDLSPYTSVAGYTFPLEPRQKISLDYTVRDWRWIVNDSAPKVSADQTEGMAVLPIRNLDDTQNTFVHTILTDSTIPPSPTPMPVPVRGSFGEGITPTGRIKGVNGRTAEVLFDTTGIEAPRTRVVYRTLDNWTQQLSVAAHSYLPYNNIYSYERWRTYVEDPNGIYLYFPPSEAGKTVAITYAYQDGANEVLMERYLLPVDEDLISKPAVANAMEPSGFVSRVELLDRAGTPLGTGTLNSIRAVEGASIQVRSAWMDGDRFSQNSIMGTRRLDLR